MTNPNRIETAETLGRVRENPLTIEISGLPIWRRRVGIEPIPRNAIPVGAEPIQRLFKFFVSVCEFLEKYSISMSVLDFASASERCV